MQAKLQVARRAGGFICHRVYLPLIVAATWNACAHAQAPVQSTLWLINADGGDLRPLGKTPGYSCGSPEWSPDGKFVAYDTWPTDTTWQQSEVAVVRADGADRRRLGPGAMPTWSPDGTQLACHTYNPHTVIVMSADGEGRETIVNHWGSPRWSPRGNRIAVVGAGGGIGLFDLANGTETQILPPRYSPRQGFAIAPDGLRFCFADSDGGLALATLDERTMQAKVRQLVNAGATYHCSWSPDGNRIVFSWQLQPNNLPQLYMLDVGSGSMPVRIDGQSRERNNVNPDWSPDGTTIVFASYAVQTEARVYDHTFTIPSPPALVDPEVEQDDD